MDALPRPSFPQTPQLGYRSNIGSQTPELSHNLDPLWPGGDDSYEGSIVSRLLLVQQTNEAGQLICTLLGLCSNLGICMSVRKQFSIKQVPPKSLCHI